MGITSHTVASDARKLGTGASTFMDAWIINNKRITVATRGTPHSLREGKRVSVVFNLRGLRLVDGITPAFAHTLQLRIASGRRSPIVAGTVGMQHVASIHCG